MSEARRFERRTRGARRQNGALSRVGLAVLQALGEFENRITGLINPAYKTIADRAGVSYSSVWRALKRLKAAGVIHWERTLNEGLDESGRYYLEQDSNVYAILPANQWRGHRATPPPPPPEPGACGEHPPIRVGLDALRDELKAGASFSIAETELIRTAGAGDELAGAVARLAKARKLPPA